MVRPRLLGRRTEAARPREGGCPTTPCRPASLRFQPIPGFGGGSPSPSTAWIRLSRRFGLIALCIIPVLALWVTGCGPASVPEPVEPQSSQNARAELEQLRRALDNIQAYLAELEGRLKISDAESWPQEAAAAQHALGNIRMELSTLRQGSQKVGSLESWLADLESRLKGASTNNWEENASAAQHIAGNIRIELQGLAQGL